MADISTSQKLAQKFGPFYAFRIRRYELHPVPHGGVISMTSFPVCITHANQYSRFGNTKTACIKIVVKSKNCASISKFVHVCRLNILTNYLAAGMCSLEQLISRVLSFKLPNGVSHMQINAAALEIQRLEHSAIARGEQKSL